MQVCVLQVYGASPVLRMYSCVPIEQCRHRICTFNLETLRIGLKVPGFRDQKHAHVKRGVNKLRLQNVSYCLLEAKGCNLLQQTRPESQTVWQSKQYMPA